MTSLLTHTDDREKTPLLLLETVNSQNEVFRSVPTPEQAHSQNDAFRSRYYAEKRDPTTDESTSPVKSRSE